MPTLTYRIKAKVWLYDGKGGWHFLTLPKMKAKEIRGLASAAGSGWGEKPVTATIGATTWKTSLFPSREAQSYLLPVKAEVRQAEGITDGSMVDVVLVIQCRNAPRR